MKISVTLVVTTIAIILRAFALPILQPKSVTVPDLTGAATELAKPLCHDGVCPPKPTSKSEYIILPNWESKSKAEPTIQPLKTKQGNLVLSEVYTKHGAPAHTIVVPKVTVTKTAHEGVATTTEVVTETKYVAGTKTKTQPRSPKLCYMNQCPRAT